MELYLDTANLAEIKEIAAWNVLSGLTTNPTLLGKQGIGVRDFMNEVKNYIKGPISLEVLGDTAEEMVADAKTLQAYGEQVVIKVPMTPEGLKAQKAIHNLGLKTNVTLVFSVNQALLAAAAGADYVSPFMGRLDDIGYNGIELIEETAIAFANGDIKTKIIAASVRTAREVAEAALAGADITTIPYGIIKKMVCHPLTDKGLLQFKADWEKGGIKTL